MTSPAAEAARKWVSHCMGMVIDDFHRYFLVLRDLRPVTTALDFYFRL